MVDRSTILRVTARFDEEAIDAISDSDLFLFTPADEVMRIANIAGRPETRTYASNGRDDVHQVIAQAVAAIETVGGQPRFGLAAAGTAANSVSRPASQVWVGPAEAEGWSWQLLARDGAGQLVPLVQQVAISGSAHAVEWFLSVELL